MLKVKVQQLVDANNSLMALGELTEIPAAVGFRVARVIRKTRDELRAWNEARTELIKATGKSEPHPQVPGMEWINPEKITPTEMRELEAQMKSLGDVLIDVEANQIQLAEFGDRTKLKPNWLADLDWLIIE